MTDRVTKGIHAINKPYIINLSLLVYTQTNATISFSIDSTIPTIE